MKVAEVVIEHVRRRIERAQRAVERQRRRSEGPGEPLREHDLHRVAGDDVVLDLAHRRLERVGAEFAARLRHRGARLERNRDRRPKPAAQLRKAGGRSRERIGHARVRVDDHGYLAREIVDDDQFLGQQEQDVGNRRKRGRCRRRRGGEPPLDVTDRVVAEHPGKTAAEARQSRRRRRAVTAQERGDERERVAFMALDDRTVVFYFDRGAVRADARSCRQSDERVAPEALAADDGFEEERVRLVGELHVQRQRRVEIRERLEDERNAVMALRGEGAEIAFVHDASTIGASTRGATSAGRWTRATPRTGRLS